MTAKSIFAILAVLGLAQGQVCGDFRSLARAPVGECLNDVSCFAEAISAAVDKFELDFLAVVDPTWTSENNAVRKLRGNQEERRMQLCIDCHLSSNYVTCQFHGCYNNGRDLMFGTTYSMFAENDWTADSFEDSNIDFLEEACWQLVDNQAEADYAMDVLDAITSNDFKQTLEIIVQEYICNC